MAISARFYAACTRCIALCARNSEIVFRTAILWETLYDTLPEPI
jgi:hypothetical protein